VISITKPTSEAANHLDLYRFSDSERDDFCLKFGLPTITSYVIGADDSMKVAAFTSFMETNRGNLTTASFIAGIYAATGIVIDPSQHPEDVLEGLIIKITDADGKVTDTVKFKFAEYTHRTILIRKAMADARRNKPWTTDTWLTKIESYLQKWVPLSDRVVWKQRLHATAGLVMNNKIPHIPGIGQHIVVADHVRDMSDEIRSNLSDEFREVKKTADVAKTAAVDGFVYELIYVIGPIAAGKTTIARLIATLLGWRHINSDVLFDTPAHEMGSMREYALHNAVIGTMSRHGRVVVCGNGSLICAMGKDDAGNTKAYVNFGRTLEKFGIDKENVHVTIVTVGGNMTKDETSERMRNRVCRDPALWSFPVPKNGPMMQEPDSPLWLTPKYAKLNAAIRDFVAKFAKNVDAYKTYSSAIKSTSWLKRFIDVDELPDELPDIDAVVKLVREILQDPESLTTLKYAKLAAAIADLVREIELKPVVAPPIKAIVTNCTVAFCGNKQHMTLAYGVGCEVSDADAEQFVRKTVYGKEYMVTFNGIVVVIWLPSIPSADRSRHVTIKSNAKFPSGCFADLARAINSMEECIVGSLVSVETTIGGKQVSLVFKVSKIGRVMPLTFSTPVALLTKTLTDE
jgi:adenylate kinase family enzyme